MERYQTAKSTGNLFCKVYFEKEREVFVENIDKQLWIFSYLYVYITFFREYSYHFVEGLNFYNLKYILYLDFDF